MPPLCSLLILLSIAGRHPLPLPRWPKRRRLSVSSSSPRLLVVVLARVEHRVLASPCLVTPARVASPARSRALVLVLAGLSTAASRPCPRHPHRSRLVIPARPRLTPPPASSPSSSSLRKESRGGEGRRHRCCVAVRHHRAAAEVGNDAPFVYTSATARHRTIILPPTSPTVSHFPRSEFA
jgi:hypothetical protein